MSQPCYRFAASVRNEVLLPDIDAIMNVTTSPPQRKSVFASRRRERSLFGGLVLLFFAVLFGLLFGLNMRRGLNHDEHQFVAAGALIARNGLLPYLDFAHFHVPLVGLGYALLYHSWDRLLLGARTLSVVFAWLSLWLIFAAAYRRRIAGQLRQRMLFALTATLWLAALPIFTYTSGRAWNHDLPVLLLLLAFFIQSDTLIERRTPLSLGAAGLLIGLASAARLSFAFALIPFVMVTWLYPAFDRRRRWIGTAAFLAGCGLGALPALVFFFMDPAAFWFANIEYIRLNTEYYRAMGAVEAMTLPGKLLFAGRLLLLQPGNGLALLVLVIGLWPLIGPLRRRMPFSRSRYISGDKDDSLFRLAFILLLLFFMLIGAFAATPSQPQYFYALFPLIILGAVYAVNAWPSPLQARGLQLFAAAALVTNILAIPTYVGGLEILFSPHEWRPNKIHAVGRQIGTLVQEDPVLTLSPILPLEGKATVYAEFATGPFAWRVAPLASPEERTRYGLVGPEELETLLAESPPAGILVGLDNDDLAEEEPLVDYAVEHGFVPVDLPDEGTLWLAPRAVFAGTIRLGGHDLPAAPVLPGQEFVLTLLLQSVRGIDTNLNVLVRVVDEQGEELMRSEGWPYGSPTSTWVIGELWRDGHTFVVPPDTAPGRYGVELAFYDPADFAPLGDTVMLGTLEIGSPAERDN